MNKNFLAVDDFIGQGRTLNLEGFTNLQKGITEADFREKYPNHEIYTRAAISKLAEDVRAKSEEIVKDESGVSKEEVLKKGADFINSLTKVTVRGENGDVDLFVREKEAGLVKGENSGSFNLVMSQFKDGNLLDDSGELIEDRSKALAMAAKEAGLVKGEEINEEGEQLIKAWLNDNVEDTLEKGDDAPSKDDLIKGELSDAISYGSGLSMSKFKKTGKEIKEALEKIESKIQDRIETIKEKKQNILNDMDVLPTEKLDNWEKRGLEKEVSEITKYPWEMTYFSEENKMNSGSVHMTTSSTKQVTKTACSREEADKAREYNRLVQECISCYRDLQKAGVFNRNLDEKKSYELTLSDLSALGF